MNVDMAQVLVLIGQLTLEKHLLATELEQVKRALAEKEAAELKAKD